MKFPFLLAALLGCQHPIPRAPEPRMPPQISVEVQAVCHYDDPWATLTLHYPIPVHGSGVPWDRHRVLTAEHVVGDPTSLEEPVLRACPTVPDLHVVFPDGRRIRAYPETEDPAHDVAVLRTVEDTGFDPFPTRAPVVGETVCSSASVPQVEHGCGPVTDVGGEPGADFHVLAVAHHGNSGGGVWGSDGSLVGLLTRGPRDGHDGEFGATSTIPR